MQKDWLASFDALKKVYTEDSYSNIAVNKALEEHAGSSPGFVRAMTKGVIRNTILLDRTIEKLSRNGLKGMKKRTLIVLRMGIFAAWKMDSIPDHAAASEAVSLAKKVCRGQSGFVNAVIRSFIRGGKKPALPEDDGSREYISVSRSFRRDLVDLICDQYGDREGLKIIDGLCRIPSLTLRCNTMKTDRDSLIEHFASSGIAASADPATERGIIAENGPIVSDDAFLDGRCTIQSLSSIMSVEEFAPEEGSRVLDMCAAPGGKSTLMAEIMNGTGEVTACDIHPHRVELIRKTAVRMGDLSVKAEVRDASEHDPALDGAYDYVLADVPCSGLGVIAGKPELKLRADPADFDGLARLQLKILENAYRYTRPGGRFMYSTCTIDRIENEEVIESFLGTHEDAEVIENRTVLPYNEMTGFFFCIMEKNSKR
jgi:16S rRNA (cytosine967-C5)-methyltransferase